jgi:hypothetical protein
MKLLILLLGLIVVFACRVDAKKTEPLCPSHFDNVFGRELSLGGSNLFVINERYLLERRFDPQCQLLEVHVAKRQVWSDPDHDAAADLNGLQMSEYEDVLSKIGEEHPLGKLIESDKIGFSHRLGTVSWGQYEHALVNRISFLVDGSSGVERLIDSFTIYFAHEVKGKLKEKSLFELKETVTRSRLLIDGDWYWSDEDTYSVAVVDREGTFRVFGAPKSTD